MQEEEVSIHALLAECDLTGTFYDAQLDLFQSTHSLRSATWPTRATVRRSSFQSTHSLRSATRRHLRRVHPQNVSIHALLAECDMTFPPPNGRSSSFNPRTPCGVRLLASQMLELTEPFQSTHSLRSATRLPGIGAAAKPVSIHALLAECDDMGQGAERPGTGFNPRTPCGVRPDTGKGIAPEDLFQSTHSLRSATAPDLIHCYSTKQIILCANLPKKTVIARLLFLSIYLSIFYSQCITPIADLPGNSCELEVGAQAMFNSL